MPDWLITLVISLIAGAGGGFLASIYLKKYDLKREGNDAVKLLLVYFKENIDGINQHLKNMGIWRAEGTLEEHLSPSVKPLAVFEIRDLKYSERLDEDCHSAWLKAAKYAASYETRRTRVSDLVRLPRDSSEVVRSHIEDAKQLCHLFKDALQVTKDTEPLSRKNRKLIAKYLREMKCL